MHAVSHAYKYVIFIPFLERHRSKQRASKSCINDQNVTEKDGTPKTTPIHRRLSVSMIFACTSRLFHKIGFSLKYSEFVVADCIVAFLRERFQVIQYSVCKKSVALAIRPQSVNLRFYRFSFRIQKENTFRVQLRFKFRLDLPHSFRVNFFLLDFFLFTI